MSLNHKQTVIRKVSKNITAFIFLLTFLSSFSSYNSNLFCQESNSRFYHLSIKDGLPDDGFTCVIQDHMGFIWVGTTNGISKYDGYSFVNYYSKENDSNSLIGRNVRCLMEDSDGDIWIGTYFGISILLRNEDRIISYEHDNTTRWININGLNHIDQIEKLGQHYKLHPLIIEDISSTTQRPKVDEYEKYQFVVLKMLYFDEEQALKIEHISFVLGANY